MLQVTSPTAAHMLLKDNDMAVFIANWMDQASNIAYGAKVRNIGTGELAFLSMTTPPNAPRPTGNLRGGHVTRSAVCGLRRHSAGPFIWVLLPPEQCIPT